MLTGGSFSPNTSYGDLEQALTVVDVVFRKPSRRKTNPPMNGQFRELPDETFGGLKASGQTAGE